MTDLADWQEWVEREAFEIMKTIRDENIRGEDFRSRIRQSISRLQEYGEMLSDNWLSQR